MKKYKVVCEAINDNTKKEPVKNIEWNIIDNRKFLDKLTTGISVSFIPITCLKLTDLQQFDCFSKTLLIIALILATIVVVIQICSARRAINYARINDDKKLKNNEILNTVSDSLFVLMLFVNLVLIIYNL